MGLIPVILGMVVLGMTTVPITKWYLSLQDSTIKIEERMQAQSYAFNEWQKVLAEDYGNVTSKSRKTVSDKYDLVREVGAEKTVSGNGKEKDVTITVYKKGTNEIAYALASAKAKPTLDEYYTKTQINNLLKNITNRLDGNEFIKNSSPSYALKMSYNGKLHFYANNSEIKLDTMAIGTIIPYIGSLSNIPDGWHLCDGTNGTPNLRGVFLRGWNSQTINGVTYSANSVKGYQTDAIKDTFGKGSVVIPETDVASYRSNPNLATGVFSYESATGYRVGGDIKYDDGAFKLNFDLTNGQNVANEFRPINYSVYYIMKIK